MMAIAFPSFIDPVAFSLGPLDVYWYGLAYAAGYLVCWQLAKSLARRAQGAQGVQGVQGAQKVRAAQDTPSITPADIERFFLWSLLGGVLGGRLGYTLIYQPGYYLAHPIEVFALGQGGMSFHGGLLGFIIALGLFAWRSRRPFWPLADLVALVVPLGLMFGRLANFANQELYGRVTGVPWAVIFADGLPRHPSQLYQAAGEGALLFAILYLLYPRVGHAPGVLTGAFLLGYGVLRGGVEFFRAPDVHLGLLLGQLTLGQWLCVPMIALGAGLIIWRRAHGS
ncbi:MAG: prolipoprotein diacylglyceryl transferase [Pseudomonadota bacterium]